MRDILTKSYLWLCMFICFYIPFIPVVHALSSIVMGLLVVIAFFIVEKPKAKMIADELEKLYMKDCQIIDIGGGYGVFAEEI